MKFISRTQQALMEGATHVASAVQKATQTVSTELQNGRDEGRSAIAAVSEQLVAIPHRLSEAARLLDARPMVADLATLLETLREQLRQLMQNAGQAGTGLRVPLQDLTAMQGEVTRVLDQIQALPAQVSQAAITDLTDMQELARQTLGRAQTVGMRVQGLPARIWAFAEGLPGLTGPDDAHDVTTAGATQAHIEVDTVRRALLAERDHLGAELALVGTRFSAHSALAAAKVQDITEALQQDLQLLMQKIDAMALSLQQALEDLRIAIGTGHERVDELAVAVTTPMAKARAAIEAVATQVDATGAMVDEVIAGIDSHLDRLQCIVDAVKLAVSDAATAVNTTLTGLRELLVDISAEIDGLIPRLHALPDELNPVYDQVGVAQGVIDDIQGSIPPFIDQADATLVQASAELDQAQALCEDAIATCTRYQMRAPALIAARLLFMGVKSSLPGIRSAITAARSTLRTAGKTASSLLDQADQAVLSVQGVLDQAVEQLRGLLERLVSLLVQLQQSLADTGTKLVEVGKMLDDQVAALNEQADAVVTEVRNKVNKAVESMQARPTVDRLAAQVRELPPALIAPLQAKLDGAMGQAHDGLNTLIDQLQQPAQALDAALNELLQHVHPLQAALDAPLQQLQHLLMQAQADLDELLQQAYGCVDQAVAQGLSALAMIESALDTLRAEANVHTDALCSRIDATATSIRINLERAPDPAALLQAFEDDCQRIQDSATQALLMHIDAARAAAEGTRRAMTKTATAEAALQEEATRITPELPQPCALEEQAEMALSPAREEAQSQAERAETEVRAQQEALGAVDATWTNLPDDMKAALDQAGEDAKSTCDHLQSEVASLAAASDAVATASNVAQEQVVVAVQSSHEEVSKLRDQAKSELGAVSEEILTAQARTDAVRSDLQRAEAIVDAEVEKHGGAPRSIGAQTAAKTADGDAAAAAGDESELAGAANPTSGADEVPSMDHSGSTDGTADSSDASTDTSANTREAETNELPYEAGAESAQASPAKAYGSAAMARETPDAPEPEAPTDARLFEAPQTPPKDDAREKANNKVFRQPPAKANADTQTRTNTQHGGAEADTAPQVREDSDIKPQGTKPTTPPEQSEAESESPHATTEATAVTAGFAQLASPDDDKLDAGCDDLTREAADTLVEVNNTAPLEVESDTGASVDRDADTLSRRAAAPELAVSIPVQLSTGTEGSSLHIKPDGAAHKQTNILPIQKAPTADDPTRLNAWQVPNDGGRRSSPQASTLTAEPKAAPATETNPSTDRFPDKPPELPPLRTSDPDAQQLSETSVIAADKALDTFDVLDAAAPIDRGADNANTSIKAQTPAAAPAFNATVQNVTASETSAPMSIPEPFESPPTP